MKTLISTLVTLTLFFYTSSLFAQDPPYFLVTTMDTYANLENPTEVTSVGDEWDDPSFTFPIGFDFTFLDETSNTLVMSDDFLGGAVSLPPTFNGSMNILFAYFDDLIDRENVDPNLQSSISYQLEGTAGQQIFKLEWKDVAFYNEVETNGTANNIINLQLWIYEGSNNFDIRFGPSNIVDSTGLIHDLDGPTIGIMDSIDLDNETFKALWHLSGDPLKPFLNNSEDVASLYVNEMLSSNPVEGMVYQFINPTSATENFVKTNAMKVYPSLVTDQFFVEIHDDILSEKTTIALNNQLGQPIYNKTITNTKTELSLSGLPSGFYYVTVFNKNGLGTEKVIKVD